MHYFHKTNSVPPSAHFHFPIVVSPTKTLFRAVQQPPTYRRISATLQISPPVSDHGRRAAAADERTRGATVCFPRSTSSSPSPPLLNRSSEAKSLRVCPETAASALTRKSIAAYPVRRQQQPRVRSALSAPASLRVGAAAHGGDALSAIFKNNKMERKRRSIC